MTNEQKISCHQLSSMKSIHLIPNNSNSNMLQNQIGNGEAINNILQSKQY